MDKEDRAELLIAQYVFDFDTIPKEPGSGRIPGLPKGSGRNKIRMYSQ